MPEDMQQFLQRKHLEAQARMRRLEEIRRQPKRPPTHKDATQPGDDDASQPDNAPEIKPPQPDAAAESPKMPKRPVSDARKLRIGSRVFRPSTIGRRITGMAEEIRRVNEEARRIRDSVTGESPTLPKRVDAEDEDVRKKMRDAELRRQREQNTPLRKPPERG
ncbi:MAG: hypothetical protein ABIH86_01250 [Planctomycetota bacterium]